MNNSNLKRVFYLSLALLILSFWLDSGGRPAEDNPFIRSLSYSNFLILAEENRVLTAEVADGEIAGKLADGARYRTRAPRYDTGLIERLMDGGVSIIIEDTTPNPWISMLMSFLPMILIFAAAFWLMSRGSRGGKGIFSVGRSRARLMPSGEPKVTFKDVAGIDEAREDLGEIVEYLRNPEKFLKVGGMIPRGVLLSGPPGTGKTLTARAVAGEAGVPFYSVAGSDFVEMFVGVGASRMRDMLEKARKSAPCIIFIDEIDAVGRRRGHGEGGGNDEREQTLNQLLVEMDGFDGFGGVIVMGATNRPDVLDPALLRPGRFDRQVTVSNPDIRGREQILRVHMSRVSLGPDVDPAIIARGMPGFSGDRKSTRLNSS